ncbi:MAG: kelch repeat-containing protein, partial [Candidatus Limnocylindria bacterium]
MTDLHNRFRTFDDLAAPDLWREIEGKALAVEPRPVRSLAWVLIVVTLLLTLALGGAVLIGSGILKLPVSVEASASPSSTPHESTAASSTPVEQRPASWTATGNMDGIRDGHTATLLPDGKVLVTGGSMGYSGELLASAELYDPGSGTWTATGSMAEARSGQTATLLPDGKVLVAGGFSGGDSGSTLASAELYDPGSGFWSATGNMIEGHSGHTATLLPDGKVLVAGSYVNSGDPLASVELYDPGSGSWTATGDMHMGRGGHAATLLL